MADLMKATAAPIPLTVGAEKFEMHPLRLRHWGRLEAWLRQQVIDLARDSIADAGDALSPQDKRTVMLAAFDKAASVCLAGLSDDSAVKSLMLSTDSGAYALWLSLRQGDSKMTLEKCQDILERVDDPKAVLTDLFRISGQEHSVPKAEPPATS